MDIAQISMILAQAETARGVQTGMIKKALDQMEQTGEQLAEMLQATAVPAEGAVDIKI